MQASTYLYLGCDRLYVTGLNIPHAYPEAFLA